jgi:hypothetical protein
MPFILLVLKLRAQVFDLPLELAAPPRQHARLSLELLLVADLLELVASFLGEARRAGEKPLPTEVHRPQLHAMVGQDELPHLVGVRLPRDFNK